MIVLVGISDDLVVRAAVGRIVDPDGIQIEVVAGAVHDMVKIAHIGRGDGDGVPAVGQILNLHDGNLVQGVGIIGIHNDPLVLVGNHGFGGVLRENGGADLRCAHRIGVLHLLRAGELPVAIHIGIGILEQIASCVAVEGIHEVIIADILGTAGHIHDDVAGLVAGQGDDIEAGAVEAEGGGTVGGIIHGDLGGSAQRVVAHAGVSTVVAVVVVGIKGGGDLRLTGTILSLNRAAVLGVDPGIYALLRTIHVVALQGNEVILIVDGSRRDDGDGGVHISQSSHTVQIIDELGLVVELDGILEFHVVLMEADVVLAVDLDDIAIDCEFLFLQSSDTGNAVIDVYVSSRIRADAGQPVLHHVVLNRIDQNIQTIVHHDGIRDQIGRPDNGKRNSGIAEVKAVGHIFFFIGTVSGISDTSLGVVDLGGGSIPAVAHTAVDGEVVVQRIALSILVDLQLIVGLIVEQGVALGQLFTCHPLGIQIGKALISGGIGIAPDHMLGEDLGDEGGIGEVDRLAGLVDGVTILVDQIEHVGDLCAVPGHLGNGELLAAVVAVEVLVGDVGPFIGGIGTGQSLLILTDLRSGILQIHEVLQSQLMGIGQLLSGPGQHPGLGAVGEVGSHQHQIVGHVGSRIDAAVGIGTGGHIQLTVTGFHKAIADAVDGDDDVIGLGGVAFAHDAPVCLLILRGLLEDDGSVGRSIGIGGCGVGAAGSRTVGILEVESADGGNRVGAVMLLIQGVISDLDVELLIQIDLMLTIGIGGNAEDHGVVGIDLIGDHDIGRSLGDAGCDTLERIQQGRGVVILDIEEIGALLAQVRTGILGGLICGTGDIVQDQVCSVAAVICTSLVGAVIPGTVFVVQTQTHGIDGDAFCLQVIGNDLITVVGTAVGEVVVAGIAADSTLLRLQEHGLHVVVVGAAVDQVSLGVAAGDRDSVAAIVAFTLKTQVGGHAVGHHDHELLVLGTSIPGSLQGRLCILQGMVIVRTGGIVAAQNEIAIQRAFKGGDIRFLIDRLEAAGHISAAGGTGVGSRVGEAVLLVLVVKLGTVPVGVIIHLTAMIVGNQNVVAGPLAVGVLGNSLDESLCRSSGIGQTVLGVVHRGRTVQQHDDIELLLGGEGYAGHGQLHLRDTGLGEGTDRLGSLIEADGTLVGVLGEVVGAVGRSHIAEGGDGDLDLVHQGLTIHDPGSLHMEGTGILRIGDLAVAVDFGNIIALDDAPGDLGSIHKLGTVKCTDAQLQGVADSDLLHGDQTGIVAVMGDRQAGSGGDDHTDLAQLPAFILDLQHIGAALGFLYVTDEFIAVGFRLTGAVGIGCGVDGDRIADGILIVCTNRKQERGLAFHSSPEFSRLDLVLYIDVDTVGSASVCQREVGVDRVITIVAVQAVSRIIGPGNIARVAVADTKRTRAASATQIGGCAAHILEILVGGIIPLCSSGRSFNIVAIGIGNNGNASAANAVGVQIDRIAVTSSIAVDNDILLAGGQGIGQTEDSLVLGFRNLDPLQSLLSSLRDLGHVVGGEVVGGEGDGAVHDLGLSDNLVIIEYQDGQSLIEAFGSRNRDLGLHAGLMTHDLDIEGGVAAVDRSVVHGSLVDLDLDLGNAGSLDSDAGVVAVRNRNICLRLRGFGNLRLVGAGVLGCELTDHGLVHGIAAGADTILIIGDERDLVRIDGGGHDQLLTDGGTGRTGGVGRQVARIQIGEVGDDLAHVLDGHRLGAVLGHIVGSGIDSGLAGVVVAPQEDDIHLLRSIANDTVPLVGVLVVIPAVMQGHVRHDKHGLGMIQSLNGLGKGRQLCIAEGGGLSITRAAGHVRHADNVDVVVLTAVHQTGEILNIRTTVMVGPCVEHRHSRIIQTGADCLGDGSGGSALVNSVVAGESIANTGDRGEIQVGFRHACHDVFDLSLLVGVCRGVQIAEEQRSIHRGFGRIRCKCGYGQEAQQHHRTQQHGYKPFHVVHFSLPP